MFNIIAMLKALFTLGSAREVAMDGLWPSPGQCFEDFSRSNAHKSLQLNGALFNKKDVSKPIHMILYSIKNWSKDFALYMQVGQCKNIEKTVFKASSPDTLERIPATLIKSMASCSRDKLECQDLYEFEVEVHVFGNGQGINYQQALTDMANTINDCNNNHKLSCSKDFAINPHKADNMFSFYMISNIAFCVLVVANCFAICKKAKHEHLMNLFGQLNALRQRIAFLEMDAESQYTELKDEVSKLKTANANLKAELNSGQISSAQMIVDLEERLDRLNTRLNNLGHTVGNLQHALGILVEQQTQNLSNPARSLGTGSSSS
jgi:uncharacterized protein YdcH (DUF465 family)